MTATHIRDGLELVISRVATWRGITLDAWRTIRRLHEDADDLRLGLQAAVSLIAERDTTIAKLENTNLHLRAQLSAALSGRTVAEERQAIERERLDAEVDARFEQRHRRGAA